MLSFSGGLFFEQPGAMVYAYLGYVLGAIMNYGLIRLVFADSVGKWLTGKSDMFKKFQAGLNDAESFWETVAFLTFIRYVAFFPFWFVNASCAVLSVGFGYFAFTTAVSTIPGSAIYTFAGRLLSDTLDQVRFILGYRRTFSYFTVLVFFGLWVATACKRHAPLPLASSACPILNRILRLRRSQS